MVYGHGTHAVSGDLDDSLGPSPCPIGDRADSDVVTVVENVGNAVVTVLNMKQLNDPGRNTAPSMQANSSGTGFIIDVDGHIVTNWHVVTGGDAFMVILADGTKVKAKLIGSDPRDDLAVVKIPAGSGFRVTR